MGTILVTGASGAVGTEVASRLRRDGHDVLGVGARGLGDTVPWRIGVDPAPQAVRQPWDVIVHAAASTRWNLPRDQAVAANVAPLEAVTELCTSDTALIQLSTSYADGLRGSAESDRLEDYHNTYEWSKAAAERSLRAGRVKATVFRFPIVFGRASDGLLSRYSGFFKMIAASVSGLLPAVVADARARFDIVPVDEVAVEVAWLVKLPDAQRPVLWRLGAGSSAPAAVDVLQWIFDEIDSWRTDRGLPTIVRPPVLTPDSWHRFFLPFARSELSPLQLRTIDLFSEFEPYLRMPAPFATDREVQGIPALVRRTTSCWAERHPRQASAEQRAWS